MAVKSPQVFNGNNKSKERGQREQVITTSTHLELVFKLFDVAHELFERVLLLVKDEVLGQLGVEVLHLLRHGREDVALGASLLAEVAHHVHEPSHG
jgi:hypothetical protein